jgi:hypothetical protein
MTKGAFPLRNRNVTGIALLLAFGLLPPSRAASASKSWGSALGPDPAKSPLKPFVHGDRWGYKDERGRAVIMPRFLQTYDFYPEGCAGVMDSAGFAFIDRKGVVRYRAYAFDNGPDDFSDGLARYIENGKVGFIDKSLRVRIPAQFDDAYPFRFGWAGYCIGCALRKGAGVRTDAPRRSAPGLWGLMDSSGTRLTPPLYGAVRIDSKDSAAVCETCESVWDGEHAGTRGGPWTKVGRGKTGLPR